jgi:hypothetical protein
MALLVRIRGNNSSGGSMERKFYSGAEPQTEHISPEEEAEVLAKMLANPIKPDPARRGNEVQRDRSCDGGPIASVCPYHDQWVVEGDLHVQVIFNLGRVRVA